MSTWEEQKRFGKVNGCMGEWVPRLQSHPLKELSLESVKVHTVQRNCPIIKHDWNWSFPNLILSYLVNIRSFNSESFLRLCPPTSELGPQWRQIFPTYETISAKPPGLIGAMVASSKIWENWPGKITKRKLSPFAPSSPCLTGWSNLSYLCLKTWSSPLFPFSKCNSLPLDSRLRPQSCPWLLAFPYISHTSC